MSTIILYDSRHSTPHGSAHVSMNTFWNVVPFLLKSLCQLINVVGSMRTLTKPASKFVTHVFYWIAIAQAIVTWEHCFVDVGESDQCNVSHLDCHYKQQGRT